MPSLRRLAGRDRPATVFVEAPLGLLDVLRDGAAPLSGEGPGRSDADGLRVAIVIPTFRRGSGGHATIATLVRGLEARGQNVELVLVDQQNRHGADDVDALFKDFFGPMKAPVMNTAPWAMFMMRWIPKIKVKPSANSA